MPDKKSDKKEDTTPFATIRVPKTVFDKYAIAAGEYASSNGWRRATNEQFMLHLLEIWEQRGKK